MEHTATQSAVSHFSLLIWKDICNTDGDTISKSGLYEILSRTQFEVETIHFTPEDLLSLKKELVEPAIPTSNIAIYEDCLLEIPETPPHYYSGDDSVRPTEVYPSPVRT
ncbi:hypothetical protein TWF281_011029 [Arthrobotrys megalospora]